MSKVIDNRVVSMEFDNSQFEKNVQTSMKTLDSLNKTLDNLPETSGKKMFSGISKAAGNVDLSGISSGIDAINSKFSALGIAGQEVIRDITRSAINFGKNAWNMTFGQIKSGGKRRALNIAEAQFRIEGLGLNYDDYYKSIDDAVTGTAYGFDEAAVAASQFASSGVQAGEDMDHALRSISGMAAMTGRSYTDLASVMEDAAAAGKVTNDTFSRLSERGLAALQEYSKRTGKSVEEIQKAARKGTISFQEFAKVMDEAYGEHATKADETFTGVTSNIRAQLSRIGQSFYSPLIENNSALVKMLQSVKAKIKETKNVTDPFATALANSFLDLATHAKKFIDKLDPNKLKPFFDFLTNTVNNLSLGTSLDNVLNGITTLSTKFEPLKKAASEAFGEIFPKKATVLSPLLKITRQFSDFTQKFFIAGETVDKFKRIFKGLFSAVSLGGKIFKDLISKLDPVSKKFGDFAGIILDVAASIGDFLTELNEAYAIGDPFKPIREGFEKLKESIEKTTIGEKIVSIVDYLKTLYNLNGGGIDGFIGTFFDLISEIPYKLSSAFKGIGLEKIGDAFFNLGTKVQEAKNKFLDFIHTASIGGVVEKIKESLSGLNIGETVGNNLVTVFAKIKDGLKSFWDAIEPLRKAVATVLNPLWEAIKQIGKAISDGLKSPGGFVNLAAMMVMFEHLRLKVLDLKFAFQDFKKYLKLLSGKNPFDFANNLDKTVGAVKSALLQLTKELKAKAILEIAGAIAILAVSFMLLASIDSDKIAQASLAMVGLLGAMAGLLKEMDTLGGGGVFQDASKGAMITNMGTALIKLSAAIMVLALAMKQLDGLEHIVDDTLVIIIFMLAFVGVAKAIEVLNIKSFNKVATSMILMSVAIKILASAMKYFDGMQWENVIQGIVSIAAMMVILVGSAIIIDKYVGNGVFNKVAVGMVVMAVAVKLLASAVETLGSMPTEDLRDGLVAILGILAAITLFGFALDKLMGSTDFIKIGAGFLLLGVSIRLIASAFKTLSEIDPDGMTQAIVVLTFTLVGLTAIMVLANDAILKTGAGLIMVAAAMLIFTAAIGILGSMEIGTLVKGVVAMAAGLLILGAALYFISGSIAGAAALLIVAVALIPFALALTMLTSLNLADLAGTILVLVVALAALTVVCYALTGALIGAAALLVLSVALLAFGVACAVLTALPLADMAATLLVVAAALAGFAVLSVVLMAALVPMAALAGIMLLISVALLALGAAVAIFSMGVATLATSGQMGAMALLTFCTVVSSNLKILTKAATVFLSLGAALLVLDTSLLVAAASITLCAGALTVLAAAMLLFAGAAIIFAASLVNVAMALTVSITMIKDLLDEGKFKDIAANAMSGIVKGFKEGIKGAVESAKELGDKVLSVIKELPEKIKKAGQDAIMGFINGLKSKLGDAKQAAATVGKSVLNKLKSVFKIKSPSRETMKIGAYVDEGLAKGIDQNTNKVTKAADDMADETLDSMSSALSVINDAMSAEANPTITPELDLTNIQNGVDSMDGLLNNRQALNISANYNANKIAEQEQISFNQAQLASLGTQLNMLSGILANQPTPVVNANVNLQGDADGVFKLVRDQDSIYTKMHGKSAFA